MSDFVFTQSFFLDENLNLVGGNDTGGNYPDFDNDDTYVPGDVPLFSPYVGTTLVNGILAAVFDVSETTSWQWSVLYNGPFIDTDVSPPTFTPVQTENFVFCFGEGTALSTPRGVAAVEDLRIGDLVWTADGRTVPVKWLGRQTLAPGLSRLRLIRVGAGALGNGLPARDLVVTADHALMIDGLLVNAGALVNGTTVTEVPLADLPGRVTVYHVETEDHDVILAEGTPAETFIDYAGRQAFDNHSEYLVLYGEDRELPEQPAPRITSARHLPAGLRARLQGAQAA